MFSLGQSWVIKRKIKRALHFVKEDAKQEVDLMVFQNFSV